MPENMMIPLNINFDYTPNQPALPGLVHLPKVYQGAPYDQYFKVKNAADGTYRDFSGYDEMRMQARLAQNKPVLFELTQTEGELVGTADQLQIVFDAAKTESLTLQVSSAIPINEVRFVYDLELLLGGVVVERLAQGIGYIVVNTTRLA